MRKIRLGTRDSQLALWQANRVKTLLESEGCEVDVIAVKSVGDLDLITPLYEMGVEGVFTKTLDAFLLSDKIDIAVHSMKDVPVSMAQGLCQGAVLERGSYEDLLIWRSRSYTQEELENQHFTVGTGSIRRQAQWLNRFPHHKIENLRGNVQTRLNKVEASTWIGAVFAKAGLERMDLKPSSALLLDWMLPAPAQGAVTVSCKVDDQEIRTLLQKLNHEPTALCVHLEREFLSILEGGCSAPVGAHAYIKDEKVHFKGNITSLDGVTQYVTELTSAVTDIEVGRKCALDIIRQGGGAIVKAIKNLK